MSALLTALCPSHCCHLWAAGHSPSFMENNGKKLPHFILIPAIMWSSWSQNISKTLLAKINCHLLIDKPSRLFWSSFYLTLSGIQLLCSAPSFLKCIYFLLLKYVSVLYISYLENIKCVITRKSSDYSSFVTLCVHVCTHAHVYMNVCLFSVFPICSP